MRRRNNIQLILLILVIALGIGYAYINSDLNINGTAQVNSANWDVHWANIAITNGSVSGTNVVTQPTISNQTTVNYSIILSTPGDYYEFTVDAVNGGSIDAMIDTINSKLNGVTITTLPAYLNYTVTYSDGVELEQNHQLLANTTEKYKVRIEYRTDINANQLPATNQTLSLQFTVTYRQATSSSVEVPHPEYTYTANLYNGEGSIYIGQAMPNNITQYTSASDALAALRLATSNNNINFYLKHIVSEGIVEESYVEFVVTSTMAQANTGMTAGTYALRGFETYDENASSTNYCKAEYYTGGYCMNPYYESNKATLLSAFGSSNCGTESDGGNCKYLYCSVSGLYASTRSDGNVSANDGEWDCSVGSNGKSKCDDGK